MLIAGPEVRSVLRALAIAGKGIEYKNTEGSSTYRAWKVRVTFEGTGRDEALHDDTPKVRVLEGYRIRLDGTRGAKAARSTTASAGTTCSTRPSCASWSASLASTRPRWRSDHGTHL